MSLIRIILLQNTVKIRYVNNKNLLDPDKIIDFESSKAINMTVNEALVLSQLHKALDGDTQAAIFIRDIIGEKPKEEIIVEEIYKPGLTESLEAKINHMVPLVNTALTRCEIRNGFCHPFWKHSEMAHFVKIFK